MRNVFVSSIRKISVKQINLGYFTILESDNSLLPHALCCFMNNLS